MGKVVQNPARLDVGNQHTQVVVLEEELIGGVDVPCVFAIEKVEDGQPFVFLGFQKGPIKENGVNGIHNEDLLVAVLERLEAFQRGIYACEENEIAATHIRSALAALDSRTRKRTERGVEGTHKV